MTRTCVRYRCEACGYESPKWLGRCTDCGEWGTFGEGEAPPPTETVTPASVALPIAAVSGIGADTLPTGLDELDRVLGGGLVAGSVTLLGGEPGMGKSTLVLQALGAIAARGTRCLLVSAEESVGQVRLRADRLGALAPELFVVSETSIPAIVAHVESLRPSVVVVDSIQTVHDPSSAGSSGSASQVRDAAHSLVRMAKERNVSTILVGHVTKEGILAGPRVLEHVVDSVLSFEGDRHHALRMLRALKHRFGPTGELGLLEMNEEGLHSVSDPSALFLADRRVGANGSVVTSVMEGNRSLCVEVQALVSMTHVPMPRRVAPTLDSGRLAMLVAVLTQRGRIKLNDCDIYASIAGNVRVVEPGADLAIALAIASANFYAPIPADTVVVGELGLGGEVRQVPHMPRRLLEASRVGFTRAIVPSSTPDVPGMSLLRVSELGEVLDATVYEGE